MSEFRKKPVVIEAVQWFKDGDHPKVIRKSDPNRYADEGIPWIETLEGGHVVTPGDWIITGVAGENYPCKPEIFAATYEPACLPTAAAPGEGVRWNPTGWQARYTGVEEFPDDRWQDCTKEFFDNPADNHEVRVSALKISDGAHPQLAGEEAVAEWTIEDARSLWKEADRNLTTNTFVDAIYLALRNTFPKVRPTPSLAGQTHSASDTLLSELLAVIHRDGGHYQAEHGTRKAVEDAIEKITPLVQTHSAPGGDEARDAALFRALAKAAYVEDRDGGWASSYRLPLIARHDGSTYDGAKPWGPLTFVEACCKAFPAAIAKESAT